MKTFKTILTLSILLILFACSDKDEQKSQSGKTSADHVWKQQTDTIKTSKDAAKKLQDSLNLQQKQLQEN
ncbi:MAG: hypothetical protein OEW97_02740 [Gammaproteobacteria bacterium]|nr:hypothetical protein [Gammaproteobacteria bacterium]